MKCEFPRLFALVVVALIAISVQAGSITNFPFGSLNSLDGYVNVQDFTNRLQVQLIINAGRIHGIAGVTNLPAIPSDKICAWVLTDEGRTLNLSEKIPAIGPLPVEAGNAGSAYAYVTFRFERSSSDKPEAVVIRLENEYRVCRIVVESK